MISIIAIPSVSLGDAGEASFSFTRIGVGSRPSALAEAMTAAGGDVNSAFYNPSLLNTLSSRNQVAFMYNTYLEDNHQSYLAAATRRSDYAVGAYLILGGVSDFERRVGPTPEPEGMFDENYFIGALTYARKLGNIDLGISGKYAYEKIDYQSASSMMFDAGISGRVNEEITLGAALKNIGTEPKFDSTSFPLSQEYRIGAAYKPIFFQQYLELMVDGVFYSDIDPKYNLGAEYNYKNYFTLRTGYGIGYESRSLSFGGGVTYRQFAFDYAFVGFKNDLGNTHRFTLLANF